MATETLPAPSKTDAGGLSYFRAILLSLIIVAIGMSTSIILRDNIGVIADISLVISAIVVSFVVTKQDWIASVWAPPLAWFVSLLTVGQFATRSTGSFKAKQVFLLVYGLGSHALWILGATILTLLIHYLRTAGNKQPVTD